MTTFRIDDCVQKINDALVKEGLPETMNPRLLRHYTQLEGMPKPLKQGKYAVYSQIHIDAVLELRRSQSVGITSKAYSYVSEARTASLQQSINSKPFQRDALSSSVFASSTSPSAMLPALNLASNYRTQAQQNALMALAQLDPPPSMHRATLASKSFQSIAGANSLATGSRSMTSTVPQNSWHEVECMDGVRLHIRNDIAKSWSDSHQDAITQTALALNPDFFKDKP